MNISTIALFCCLDDFCKLYHSWEENHLIPRTGKRRRMGKLKLSEMMFIMVLFHLSHFRCFKLFYIYGIGLMNRNLFKEIPCYSRFVQLIPRLFLPFCVLMHYLRGEETGIYIADSTHLAVCHNKRISRHKTFEGIAKRGKTTMGWFFGMKLHIVINHKGEILAVKITPGNKDDRAVLDSLTKGLKGKIFADKGYISKKMFTTLYNRGLKLITGIRKNMKNYLMELIDKILLRKRFLVETVFDNFKSQMGLEHTRHRSVTNACVHILSCLAAYQLKTRKPKMKNMP
jgi:IS5 family transposase